MTMANESKLVIIGGFSSEDYFNDVVYVYDTYPYPTVWERHGTDNVTGAKPTGMFWDVGSICSDFKAISDTQQIWNFHGVKTYNRKINN
ncbi:hypothetical protein DPMN_153408 [Dreissena polymorpha]|uniref:Galactose oxidase n=1 Tax=Dreissena polymorpha TaxID=45954 RepID=A0A9D4J9D1_DREPO|nr:hypothetical protein DPMN_153408 [Dreissena polymorpha]